MSYTLELWEEWNDWTNIEAIETNDIILDTDKFLNFMEWMVNLYLDNQDDELMEKVENLFKNLW